MGTNVFIFSLYDWRTLVIALILFSMSFSYAFLGEGFGGCSGCIPDGEGGVTCVDECPDPSPWIYAAVSYLISYIGVILYRWKRSG